MDKSVYSQLVVLLRDGRKLCHMLTKELTDDDLNTDDLKNLLELIKLFKDELVILNATVAKTLRKL